MTATAAGYLRETSLSMHTRYTDDCVTHACRIAALLLAEGRAPWIGRLREVIAVGEHTFHGPLRPLRFHDRNSVTWTTHYVACSGDEVHDPLAAAPLDRDRYTMEVFGRPLAIDVFLDVATTARLLASGELRSAMQLRG